MRTSKFGIALIKRFEGCRLEAYQCSAGIWTIGYGHTGGVQRGDSITQIEADELLAKDLLKFELGVCKLVKAPLNQNQFDALVSFAYNCGLHALKTSTLLRKIHTGNLSGAAEEFLRWNKAGGKVLAGLTTRREAEKTLFETEDK